jgi:hypothetical protein
LARNYSIQLQNPDRTHCRYIGTSELADMENRGEVETFTKGKKGNIIARLKPKVESLRSMHEASQTCISYADVLANVGLTDRPNSTIEISRGRVLAAQAKIAAYGNQAMRCTWNGSPQPGFDVHITVILNVGDEVLGFDDTSEPAEPAFA